DDDDVADGCGAAYVFKRTGDTWAEEDKLIAVDAEQQFDEMGFSVAIHGDTVVAGAHYDSFYDVWTGAAYVFERSGTDWSQTDKLYAEDPGRGNQFGWSVAVHGDTAVVGAVFQGSGSAYVYRRSSPWTFEQKLPRVGIGANASFGHSVAVQGDVAVVGAPGDTVSGYTGIGSAWVYTRDGTTWTHLTTLSPQDPSDQADGVQFGVWVGINDGAVVAGAAGDAENGQWAGAAYVNDFDPDVGVDPPDADTGPVPVGRDSAPVTITVSNEGLAPLTVGTVSLSGPDAAEFEIRNDNASGQSIPAGGSATLEVVFRPASEGAKSASVDVPSDDPDTPSLSFALQGLGAPPNDACLLPKKVKVGKKGLVSAGTLHLGPDDVNLALPLTIDIGDQSFVLPALTEVKGGKKYTHKDEKVRLVVKPSNRGSSRAKFKLRAAAEPADGALAMRFTNDDLDAGCTVTLVSGRFRLGKGAGSLAEPAMVPEKAKGKLLGGGKDGMKIVARWAGDGKVPTTPPDFSVGFGDGFQATVASADFVPRGNRFLYRGSGTGLTKLVIDYARGQIALTVKRADLGSVPEGPSAVELKVALGDDERTIRIRMARRKKALRY
ncbi:MAG: choice-of-anchor D domain-containing protein, partial [Planctomycetota bacterium]